MNAVHDWSDAGTRLIGPRVSSGWNSRAAGSRANETDIVEHRTVMSTQKACVMDRLNACSCALAKVPRKVPLRNYWEPFSLRSRTYML